MPIQTVLYENGVETVLAQYDAFQKWIQDIVHYFETVTDYKGYPMLPDNIHEGMEIYERASEREKSMIAMSAITAFTEALRHWRTDQDMLYDPQKRSLFVDLLEFTTLLGNKPKIKLNLS